MTTQPSCSPGADDHDGDDGGTRMNRVVTGFDDSGQPSVPDGDPLEDAHEGFQDAHATETLDYVTVLSGQVTLVIGGAEVTLGPGDSVVQQPGVPHDWLNRTSQRVVMA